MWVCVYAFSFYYFFFLAIDFTGGKKCTFYTFHQESPDIFEMMVPADCFSVFVREQAYTRMSGKAFFRAFYNPIRASDLTDFQVTLQGTCKFPTKNLSYPSPHIKFGSIVADQNLLSGKLADKNTDEMKKIFESAFVFDEEKIPEL